MNFSQIKFEFYIVNIPEQCDLDQGPLHIHLHIYMYVFVFLAGVALN